jgi:hypothetical protein
MIPRAAIGLCLVLPTTAVAQGVHDRPRALDIFTGLAELGYSDLAPDRYGTPANPVPNELGMLLVSRMFRTVCLGLESGAPLDAVMPDGFDNHTLSFWLMGDDTPREGGPIILSSTGDIATDEDDGHPYVELSPDAGGMTCRVSWRIPGPLETTTQSNIAELIATWLPWEYALVDAARPEVATDPGMSRLIEWDRPCGERWCEMTALFSLGSGDVSLTTTLNITGIEGTRP